MAEHSEDAEERAHWIWVMRTLVTYEEFVLEELARRQAHLCRLPLEYSDRLPDSTFMKLKHIEDASKFNQQFMEEAVRYYSQGFFRGSDQKFPGKFTADENSGIPAHQQHRNEAVLHSLYREWSAEGQRERDQSFGPIIQELQRLLPVTRENCYKQRVLVPGAGLARLPLEITSVGYASQGNEFSAFMAIPSNFMLNEVNIANCFSIHPWIDRVSNVVKIEDLLQSVSVPDVTAESMLMREIVFEDGSTSASLSKASAGGADGDESAMTFNPNTFPRFSMCLGDFVDIYGAEDNKDFWDGITTCFFVDTAPVVIDYVRVIHHLLRPGGVWINQGPLLYHWTTDSEGNNDERYARSIELSWEELKHVILGYGFEFITEEMKECNYTHCTTAMMWNTYRTLFFSVRKPLVK